MTELTEEQARGLWCPFSRGEIPRCIAFRCMAWRWATGMISRRIYKGAPDWDAYQRARSECSGRGDLFFAWSGATWRYDYSSSDSLGTFDVITRSADEGGPKHGYCGLAGRPS